MVLPAFAAWAAGTGSPATAEFRTCPVAEACCAPEAETKFGELTAGGGGDSTVALAVAV